MPPKKGKKEPKVTVPEGDAKLGKGVFETQCAVCHGMEKGDDKNAAAPNLNSLIGRTAGTGSFPYSNSMKKSGIKWSAKHLFVFLKGPGKYVPGTRMSFAGIPDENDRADLIAYLTNPV